MNVNDQTENKNKTSEKISLAIIGGLLLIADILVVLLYLVFAFASTFNVSSFLKPFVYISFTLSLLVLLVSSIKALKSFAQKNKSFSLIVSVFIALVYTSLRMNLFPDAFQFEDVGTAVIIVLSYLAILFEKKDRG